MNNLILYVFYALIFLIPLLAFWRGFKSVAILSGLMMLLGTLEGFGFFGSSAHYSIVPMGWILFLPAIIVGVIIDSILYFQNRRKTKSEHQ